MKNLERYSSRQVGNIDNHPTHLHHSYIHIPNTLLIFNYIFISFANPREKKKEGKEIELLELNMLNFNVMERNELVSEGSAVNEVEMCEEEGFCNC